MPERQAAGGASQVPSVPLVGGGDSVQALPTSFVPLPLVLLPQVHLSPSITTAHVRVGTSAAVPWEARKNHRIRVNYDSLPGISGVAVMPERYIGRHSG